MSYCNTIKDKKEEDKLLIAKIEDKIRFCNSKNKITYTDFMQLNEKSLAKKILNDKKIKKYFFFGGINNPDREIIVFFPDKLTEEMARNNLKNIIKVIYIKLPNNQHYDHKEYLSGIMKLGIKREKFGDIIVRDNGADVIVLNEILDYLIINLPELTRFKKSEISVKNFFDINEKEENFEEYNIIISSNRLDNFVAELARCSRSMAQEILNQDRVFVNGILEEKESKRLQEGDKITIRGKGKFIFEAVERNTKSDRLVINIKKYS